MCHVIHDAVLYAVVENSDPHPSWRRQTHNSVAIFLIEHVSMYLHNCFGELEFTALLPHCPLGQQTRWGTYINVAAYLVAATGLPLVPAETAV